VGLILAFIAICVAAAIRAWWVMARDVEALGRETEALRREFARYRTGVRAAFDAQIQKAKQQDRRIEALMTALAARAAAPAHDAPQAPAPRGEA
jgi:hypothetical protein